MFLVFIFLGIWLYKKDEILAAIIWLMALSLCFFELSVYF